MTESAFRHFEIVTGESLAYQDDLTGLPNRRFLDKALDHLIDSGESFAICFVDIDNFKHVNDSLGHQEGDKLLRRFADLVGRCVRTGDIVVRHGGDEFVVILPGANTGAAQSIAGRIVEAVSETLKRSHDVTASLGIALFPEDAREKRELIALADNAMYLAKATGKACWRRAAARAEALYWREDVFVGRKGAVQRLLDRLTPDPSNKMTFVVGESGIGKTALIGEITKKLPRDMTSLQLNCRAELSAIPYAPLISAVRSAIPFLSKPNLPLVWTKVLSVLFPDHFQAGESPPQTFERVALLQALSALLRSWSPLVVIVHGSHWLDRDTAEFLVYLYQFGMTESLAICCAVENEELARSSDSPVNLLQRTEDSTAVVLEALDAYETTELIRGRLGVGNVSREVTQNIFEASGGNPLIANELLRSLLETSGLKFSGQLDLVTRERTLTATDRIRTLIADKLVKLEDEERRVLLYASLVGCSFDLSTLGRLTGLSDGKILTGLDRSAKLGFITESTSDPFTFSFSNPIYREEISRASDAGAKRSAHLRIAADLKDSDSFSTRALHLENAGEYDKAIRAYISAAHQSIGRQLPQVALRHLQEAERLRTRDQGEVMIDSEILALDSDLARAYYECGQLEDARARYLRVAALSERTGNATATVGSRIKAAVMLRMTERFDEALAELRGLEKTAEGTNLASVLLEEVDALARISRFKEAKRILRRVERFLARRPTDATRVRTQYHHRKMLIAVSEQEYAVAATESRMVVGATKSTSTKWWRHHDLAEAYLFAGKVPSAIRNFEKALVLAMDTPSILGEIWAKIGLATASFYALRHRRARDLIEEAEELARRTEDLNAISNVFLTKARLKLDSMAYDNAEGLIQSAIVLWPGSPILDYFASLLEAALGNNSIALESIEKAIDSVKKKKTVLQMISGVLISMDDLVVHRERVRLELGQTDGMLVRLAELIPDLYPRTRLRLQGVLAEYHVRLGREALAAKTYDEALSSPDCRYESRERYFMLRQWGKWNREADKKATRMALRMRE